MRVFMTLLLTSVFINGFLFLGSVKVTTALQSMEHAIALLIALLDGVLASTEDILLRLAIITQTASSSSACAAFAAAYMLGDMTNLSAAAESSGSVAITVLSTLHTLESYCHNSFLEQKDLVI